MSEINTEFNFNTMEGINFSGSGTISLEIEELIKDSLAEETPFVQLIKEKFNDVLNKVDNFTKNSKTNNEKIYNKLDNINTILTKNFEENKNNKFFEDVKKSLEKISDKLGSFLTKSEIKTEREKARESFIGKITEPKTGKIESKLPGQEYLDFIKKETTEIAVEKESKPLLDKLTSIFPEEKVKNLEKLINKIEFGTEIQTPKDIVVEGSQRMGKGEVFQEETTIEIGDKSLQKIKNLLLGVEDKDTNEKLNKLKKGDTSTLGTRIGGIWGKILEFFSNPSNIIMGVVGMAKVFEKFPEIAKTLKNVWETVEPLLKSTIDITKNMFSILWDGLKKLGVWYNEHSDQIKNFVGDIGQGIKNVWEMVKFGIHDTASLMGEWSVYIEEDIQDLFAWFGKMSVTIENFAKDTIEFSKQTFENIKNGFNSVINWFKDLINNIENGITLTINSVKNAFSWISDKFNSIKNWWDNLWNTAEKSFEEKRKEQMKNLSTSQAILPGMSEKISLEQHQQNLQNTIDKYKNINSIEDKNKFIQENREKWSFGWNFEKQEPFKEKEILGPVKMGMNTKKALNEVGISPAIKNIEIPSQDNTEQIKIAEENKKKITALVDETKNGNVKLDKINDTLQKTITSLIEVQKNQTLTLGKDIKTDKQEYSEIYQYNRYFSDQINDYRNYIRSK